MTRICNSQSIIVICSNSPNLQQPSRVGFEPCNEIARGALYNYATAPTRIQREIIKIEYHCYQARIYHINHPAHAPLFALICKTKK